ncbi:hypothetical protein [Sphingomonas sp. GC_Shp_3]|uniref:hypothetical protein n=1 Tax=Sphingomonas sp. GC_Shp_3 TaxID=2937383 RepID=UPI0022699174|nr:hypothetical protein [Sphingomonas sp. GC_Shp_3]
MTVVPIDKSAEYIGQVHDRRYRRKPLWKVVRSDQDKDHMRMDVLKVDMSHCQQKPSNKRTISGQLDPSLRLQMDDPSAPERRTQGCL